MKILTILVSMLVLVSFSRSDFYKPDKKVVKLYNKKCKKCHGKFGEGIKNKKKKPPINELGKKDSKKLFKTIRKGYKGKIGKMPKLSKKKASDKEIKGLVEYIKSFDKSLEKKKKKNVKKKS